MAVLDDLVSQVPDRALRERLVKAVGDFRKRQKFGLVFEEHIPETTAIYGLSIQVGGLVQRRRDLEGKSLFRVARLTHGGKQAVIVKLGVDGQEETVEAKDLLVVKRFGEPMYAALTPVGAVRRGPKDRPHHAVVNGENFHALQLFAYLFEKSVDCIYIDPPYNTGARDWKYNNRFVDNNDAWRHSKWLAMMDKRLRLAKKLLKPDGVVICMVDEHEVHHLGMLLEKLFSGAYRQMVTIVVNPKGVTQERFSRVEEYAIFCFLGNAAISSIGDDLLTPLGDEEDDGTGVAKPRWKGLLRSGTNSRREDRRNMFYPVLVDADQGAVVDVGEPLLPLGEKPNFDKKIKGLVPAWPVRKDVSLGNWGVGHKTLKTLIGKGYVSLGQYDKKRRTWGISYLARTAQEQIATGVLEIVAHDKGRNVVDVRYTAPKARRIKAVWHRTTHDAGAYGADLLRSLLGEGRKFSFPKSVYAVRDCLAAVIAERRDALVLDFFAGSGTTLHSVCLLNAQDGGQRRCILVTNNEVEEKTARRLIEEGHAPGDREFERHGIFEEVTRPRVEAVVRGVRPDGKRIPKEVAGFPENVGFFRLDYLDPDEIELGEQFEAVVRALWLAAAGIGQLDDIPKTPVDFYIPKNCPFAILFKASRLRKLLAALEKRPDVTRVWIVTDSEEAYAEACAALPAHVRYTSQLYRDYLRTFRVNAEPK